MKIILIRHGKVNTGPKKKRYNSREYDEYWARYETCPIFPINKRLKLPETAKIFATTFQRTQDTVRQFLGREDFTIVENLANEIPLRSFTDTKKRFRMWFLNFMGRFQWYFPGWRQEECRRESYARALQLIEFLEEQGEELCVMVMHGFMMRTVGRALSDMGYKVKNKRVFAVPNLCVVEGTK